jgi:hypothetical protein
MAYEQKRAAQVFDASKLISELPESFEHILPEKDKKINKEMIAKMLVQEKICQKFLEGSVKQARW